MRAFDSNENGLFCFFLSSKIWAIKGGWGMLADIISMKNYHLIRTPLYLLRTLHTLQYYKRGPNNVHVIWKADL